MSKAKPDSALQPRPSSSNARRTCSALRRAGIKGGGALEKYLGVQALKPFINLDLVLEGMVPFSLPEVEGLEQFEAWAVIEIFGHQRIAGRVSEQLIGGAKLIRVDVPATTDRPGYTKYFGTSAVFSLTPCSEEVARLAAHQIEKWSEPLAVQIQKQLPPPPPEQRDFDDDGDSEDWRR